MLLIILVCTLTIRARTCTLVVFYAYDLLLSANRSIIDLSSSTYSMPLMSALKEENRTVPRKSLLNADIRYFLVPKQNNKYYDLYTQFSNSTLLFEMMNYDPYFLLVKEIEYFELFKLLSDTEMRARIC